LFFDQFALFLERPKSGVKLRELILQMAFRGKLLSQLPNEGTAQVLLEKIANIRNGAVKNGKTRITTVDDLEKPHEIPLNWEWVRLRDVIHYDCGQKVNPVDIISDAWLLDLEDIEKDSSRILRKMRFADRRSKSNKTRFFPGDVLYGKLRPYLNKVIVADAEGYCTTEIVALRGYFGIEPKYLMYSLKRPEFIAYINDKSYGVKMPRLGSDDARLSWFPLAPLEEQKRIVVKIGELMHLCDDLEARQQSKRESRGRLNNAVLAPLNKVSSLTRKQFQTATTRLADNFDTLYDSIDTVAKLRSTIVQVAVQGKLVPQDLRDIPASALLRAIEDDKKNLVQQKRIENSDDSDEIARVEEPFDLPRSWRWVRLAQITNAVHYGYTASADHSLKDVRLLRITDIQNSYVDWERVPGCVIEEKHLSGVKLADNDILIARTGGTIGKSYIVKNLCVTAVFASYLIRAIPNKHLHADYLKTFLDSDIYWSQLYAKSMGTGQPNVNATSLKSLMVPLPPVEEQKRIVAKVSQLMSLCDELEAKLRGAEANSENLMKAAVHHVLRAL